MLVVRQGQPPLISSMAADPAKVMKTAAALVMLGAAGVLLWQFVERGRGDSELAFFYDISEQRLFVGARDLIPPVHGLNDATEDGVRAVVVSTNGRPDAKSTWRIAYLETYSPELKLQLEAARAAGTSPPMDRAAAQEHRLVKRPEDREWVSLATPEGEQIVSEWTTWGRGETLPVVCAP